jgi:hypothetical protein
MFLFTDKIGKLEPENHLPWRVRLGPICDIADVVEVKKERPLARPFRVHLDDLFSGSDHLRFPFPASTEQTNCAEAAAAIVDEANVARRSISRRGQHRQAVERAARDIEGHSEAVRGLVAPSATEELIGSITPTAPLPAALPLFAGGLGLIGMIGRKRRKAQAV